VYPGLPLNPCGGAACIGSKWAFWGLCRAGVRAPICLSWRFTERAPVLERVAGGRALPLSGRGHRDTRGDLGLRLVKSIADGYLVDECGVEKGAA